MRTHGLESLYKSIFKFNFSSSPNHISSPTFEIYHCPDVPSYLRQFRRAGLLVLYIKPNIPRTESNATTLC